MAMTFKRGKAGVHELNPSTKASIKNPYCCEKCKKFLEEKDFFKYKNGNRANRCKECVASEINLDSLESIIKILEEFNVPYMPYHWLKLDKKYGRKMGGKIIGKYLAICNLAGYKNYGFNDTFTLITYDYIRQINEEDKK